MPQSSVEWLEKNIRLDASPFEILELFEQAKAMHKQEIETAYQSERYPCSDEDAQDYYNQTFGK